jgi:hypothetical protein
MRRSWKADLSFPGILHGLCTICTLSRSMNSSAPEQSGVCRVPSPRHSKNWSRFRNLRRQPNSASSLRQGSLSRFDGRVVPGHRSAELMNSGLGTIVQFMDSTVRAENSFRYSFPVLPFSGRILLLYLIAPRRRRRVSRSLESHSYSVPVSHRISE